MILVANFSRIFVTFFFLIATIISSFAQNGDVLKLTGQVLDSISKEPIAFANILLRAESDSSILRTAVSNENGGFEVLTSRLVASLLEIRGLGYRKWIGRIEDSMNRSGDLGTIFLTAAPINLDEVTIREDKPLFENQAGKLIVNLDNGTFGSNMSIIELMNQLPGIQVTPDEQIRYNGRGIQVFIDGKASPLSVEGLKGMLRSTSYNSYQRIEIISWFI